MLLEKRLHVGGGANTAVSPVVGAARGALQTVEATGSHNTSKTHMPPSKTVVRTKF
jgi:hypothetical protein